MWELVYVTGLYQTQRALPLSFLTRSELSCKGTDSTVHMSPGSGASYP